MSELFPPAVGGSAVLLGNIYGRISRIPVTVLADRAASGGETASTDVSARRWEGINGRLRGISSRAELQQTWRVSRTIRREWHRERGLIVHAARPLPEGLPALVARGQPPFGPRYLCWAHGEELTAALSSREHGWLARRVCRAGSLMIGSSGYSSSLIASLGVPADRIRTVYPGVDPARFHPGVDGRQERAMLAPSGPMLLSVGRLQRRKGHDLTISAVARLRDRYPNLQYVIAGEGAERPRLEQLVAEHGVEGNVTFIGGISDERLPTLYAACDVFMMPTRQDGADVEGFGIVFLEAAASGRPTIGGRNGGVPEAIAEGETGLLVSGSDPAELAAAIHSLLRSDSPRMAMGLAGRERVCEHFTWERAARTVEAIHGEVSAADV